MISILIVVLIILSSFVKSKSNVLCCGIFGGIGYILADKIKMLMVYNETRGGHAVGYWNPTEGLVKRAKKTPEFLEEVGNTMKDSNLCLGHTRFGTHGSNVDKNAHPFQKDNIILIHNGVLSNHDSLAKTYGFDWTVDSEAIPEMVLRQGYKGIEEVRGSIACAWTDGDNTLHLYKRDNPLFIGDISYTDGTKGTYFSSMENSLKSIGCHNIKTLTADTYYQYDQEGLILNQEKLKVPTYQSTYKQKGWEDYRKESTKSPSIGKNYGGKHYDNWDDSEEDFYGNYEFKEGKYVLKVTVSDTVGDGYENEMARGGLKEIDPPKLLGEKTSTKNIVDVEEEESEVVFINKNLLEDCSILLLEVYGKLSEVAEWDMRTPELMVEVKDMLKELTGMESMVLV